MTKYSEQELRRLETLADVIKRLRSPDGCPWDREQTARTLRQFVIEEAYEVVEAIDSGNPDRLKEELGDLLLQIVLQARIGEEDGQFNIEDVIEGINGKLIRRHRWVFGDEEAESPDAALKSWNRIKVEERGGAENGASVLDGLPTALPALLKAFSLTQRAAHVGFDWQSTKDVVEKMHEELQELENSIESGSEGEIENEIGDLLFVLVNIARQLGINPELALQRSNRKFISRFRYIEEKLSEQGRSPSDSSLQEMDAIWDEAKKNESGRL